MATEPDPAPTVLLSYGHESGRSGVPWCAAGYRSAPAGRELAAAVDEALHQHDGPVCVVPMTLGRDPGLVGDSARAARWAAGQVPEGRVALCESFGTADHLIGWLRASAVRAATHDGHRRALLITAPASNPFDDAELFRIAHLVRRYGGHRWVEVAFAGGDPDIDEGIRRCRTLGAERIRLVPAGFAPAGPGDVLADPHTEDGGPLLTPAAIRGVVSARVAAATARLARADNGIASGLDAEHGHGYAHAHGPPGPDGGPHIHHGRPHIHHGWSPSHH